MIHNASSSESRHDLLFTKYSIKLAPNGDDYLVHKYTDAGQKELLNGAEKAEVLSGRALKGAIGFTKDKKHSGLLHFFLFFAQTIHEFVTGRWKKWNVDGVWKKSYAASCHGYIVTGEALDRTGRTFARPPNLTGQYHPMMMVDPVFPGVLTYARDNVRDPEITKCYFYKPRDRTLAEIVRAHAIQTALPKQSTGDVHLPITQWKYYQPGCLTDLTQKINFSKLRLVACLGYNGKKLVSKNPSDRICKTTALVVADLMLGNGPANLRDGKGEKRSFFCCSYVTTLFQGALFMHKIQDISPQVMTAFVSDAQGRALGRKALQMKVLNSFAEGQRDQNEVARIFHDTFRNVKFARADGEFFSSGRFVELADKSAFSKSRQRMHQI